MAAFYQARKARKRYRCDGVGYPGPCVNIRPGDIYVKATATPDHDGLGNQGWWVLRYCTVCAKDYDGPSAALAERCHTPVL